MNITLKSQEEEQLDKIEKAYSSHAWWYDLRGFLILTFAYRSTLPSQVRFFAGNIGARHLEAAIGTGTLFDFVMKWRKFKRSPKAQIIGFDYAPRMLEGAKSRFKNEAEIELELADVNHLKYSDNSFDTANIANALHCFPDMKAGIQEIHRVLRPGGTLAGNVLLYPKGTLFLDRIATQINQWGIKKGILFRPYTQAEVQKTLQESKFKIVHERVAGNCYEFVAQKTEEIL